MSIDFKAIPQYLDELGKPRLGAFKYYGQPGLIAEDNPKVPYVDTNFVTPAAAEQELTDLGQTSVQLFLDGFYSIAVFTLQKDDPEAVLIERADFVGAAEGGTGSSDRVLANAGNTTVTDEAGSVGLFLSAISDSSLQYIDVLMMDWNATQRQLYYPDGATAAMFIDATNVLTNYPSGNNAIDIDATSTTIDSPNTVQAVLVQDGTTDLSAGASTDVLQLTATTSKMSVSTNVDAVDIGAADTAIKSTLGNVTVDALAGILNLNANGALNILSDTGEIDITTTAGIVDINASGNLELSGGALGILVGGTGVDITATTGAMDLLASSGAMNLTSSGIMALSTSAAVDITVDTDADILLTAGLGDVKISSAIATEQISATTAAIITASIIDKAGAAQNSDHFIEFFKGGTSVLSGVEIDAASAPAFWNTSDRRLKSNYSPLKGMLDKINKVPVYSGDKQTTNAGIKKTTYWIADELQAEFPELVSGVVDEVDEKGKPVYQTVSRKMEEIFWSALSEASKLIEDLQTRLTDLESK